MKCKLRTILFLVSWVAVSIILNIYISKDYVHYDNNIFTVVVFFTSPVWGFPSIVSGFFLDLVGAKSNVWLISAIAILVFVGFPLLVLCRRNK